MALKCSGQVDTPPPPPPACEVKYRIQNQWDTGFTATVDIKNTGGAWNGWTDHLDYANWPEINPMVER